MRMVFPQMEDGLMKIMLCWNRNWNDDCTTPSFSSKIWVVVNASRGESWNPLEVNRPEVKSPDTKERQKEWQKSDRKVAERVSERVAEKVAERAAECVTQRVAEREAEELKQRR